MQNNAARVDINMTVEQAQQLLNIVVQTPLPLTVSQPLAQMLGTAIAGAVGHTSDGKQDIGDLDPIDANAREHAD